MTVQKYSAPNENKPSALRCSKVLNIGMFSLRLYILMKLTAKHLIIPSFLLIPPSTQDKTEDSRQIKQRDTYFMSPHQCVRARPGLAAIV